MSGICVYYNAGTGEVSFISNEGKNMYEESHYQWLGDLISDFTSHNYFVGNKVFLNDMGFVLSQGKVANDLYFVVPEMSNGEFNTFDKFR